MVWEVEFFLATDVILLRFWNIVFHSSVSLVNTTLVTEVFCILFWCVLQYGDTLQIFIILLGLSSTVYVFLVHLVVMLHLVTHLLNGRTIDTGDQYGAIRREIHQITIDNTSLRVAIFQISFCRISYNH